MSGAIVTILTPNGRRQNVKVQPNKTILQILEEVCSKYNYQPCNYDLRHHKRILDLSQPFRFSGLPNNAQIEMIERTTTASRIEQDVQLVVQLENGNRLTGTFHPTDSVAHVLEELIGAEKIHDGGQNLVVVYMRMEIYGEALQSTMLRSIGLTGGRAIFRLIEKNPELLKIQANVSAPLLPSVKSDNSLKKTLVALDVQSSEIVDKPNDVSVVVESKQKKLENTMETDVTIEEPHCSTQSPENRKKIKSKLNPTTATEEAIELPISMEINEDELKTFLLDTQRGAILFTVESANVLSLSTTPSTADIDDGFFDLNVEDIRILWRDLKANAAELNDAPLLTEQLREIQVANQTMIKLSKYKSTVLRIQFSNQVAGQRLVLQATFSPVETVAVVIDFVRQFLSDATMNFYFYTTPPKIILPKESTLVELHCVPTALLHFGCDRVSNEPGNLLRPDVVAKCTTANIALKVAAKSRRECKRPNTNTASTSSGRQNQQSGSATQNNDSVPKWFKSMDK